VYGETQKRRKMVHNDWGFTAGQHALNKPLCAMTR
jgi:hypothetical protein